MKHLICVLATAAVMFAAPAFAQQFDLVINGGRVMDPETMFDSIANVGTRSNLDQINKIASLLDEDLRQSAIGIGVGAAYMAIGLTTYEQFEVQKAAVMAG
jgi:hypothetical protein